MNKLKLVMLTTALFSGATFAADSSCDGYQIRLKNSLKQDLYMTKMTLSNAALQPALVDRVKSKVENVFVVNQSSSNQPMVGEFEFYANEFPGKLLKIKFTLESKNGVCEYTDNSPVGDYTIDKVNTTGLAQYTVTTI